MKTLHDLQNLTHKIHTMSYIRILDNAVIYLFFMCLHCIFAIKFPFLGATVPQRS